jgi:O-antigen/teichoic acid export membrane protein
LKLQQIVSGIASGYVTKLAQLVVSLMLVPFFLRDDVLGLEGFGRTNTIIAVIAFLPLLTDGLASSFMRSVSRSLDRSEDGLRTSDVLGAGFKILGSACGLAIGLLMALSPFVLSMVGLEPSRHVAALALAGAAFWVENICIVARTPLVGRGQISVVNATCAAEVMLRAVAYLAVFTAWPATLVGYFAIQLAFVLLRTLVLLFFLATRWPDDLRGWWRAPWAAGRASVREAWSITTQMGFDVIAHRVPIVVVNRFLGPEASGLAALAVNTIRMYVLHSLFAVLQPIAVPLAARIDPRRISPGRRELLWRLEAVFVFVSGLLVTSFVAAMSYLIPLWLGPSYTVVILPVQAMLLACVIEIAFNGRLSLLFGNGLLGAAVPGYVAAAAVSLTASTVAAVVYGSWQLAVFGVALYFPLATSLGTDRAFRRHLLTEPERPRSHPLAFLVLGTGVAWALSTWTGDGLAAAVAGVAIQAVAMAVLAHFLLLPLPAAYATLRTLRNSLDRSILAEPDAGPTRV